MLAWLGPSRAVPDRSGGGRKGYPTAPRQNSFMPRTLAIFGLLCTVVLWNFYPPWLFQRPGRPVCIEFHSSNWIPVVTDELWPPAVYSNLLLAGNVLFLVLLAWWLLSARRLPVRSWS